MHSAKEAAEPIPSLYRNWTKTCLFPLIPIRNLYHKVHGAQWQDRLPLDYLRTTDTANRTDLVRT